MRGGGKFPSAVQHFRLHSGAILRSYLDQKVETKLSLPYRYRSTTKIRLHALIKIYLINTDHLIHLLKDFEATKSSLTYKVACGTISSK